MLKQMLLVTLRGGSVADAITSAINNARRMDAVDWDV